MIFDGHCDIWTDITVKRLAGEKEVFKKYHLDSFRQAKINGGIFVIWVDPPHDICPKERAVQIVSCMNAEIEESKDIIKIVKKYSDIEDGIKDNKINVVIGMEGLSCLEGDISLLEYYHDKVGVRHASLTWNEQNEFATGCRGDINRGLTELGKEAVKKLEDLNIIVDVSHLNEKSFWDVLNIARKPLIASHSNANNLCKSIRNLSDEQLKAIAKTGGIIGLNSFKDFVGSTVNTQDIEKFADHIDYIVNLVGIEHVGYGFDFNDYLEDNTLSTYANVETSPGIDGLKTTNQAQNIVLELKKRGYTNSELELIGYKNFYRLFKEIIR